MSLCTHCGARFYGEDGDMVEGQTCYNPDSINCRYHKRHKKEMIEGVEKLKATKQLGENPKDRLGVQKPSMHLVPVDGLIAVGEVMKIGAAKYGSYNWRDNAVILTVYLDAMLRHYAAYLDGQDLDPESDQPHTAHIAACMLILLDAEATGNLVDDRPTKGKAAEIIKNLTQNFTNPNKTLPDVEFVPHGDRYGKEMLVPRWTVVDGEGNQTFYDTREGFLNAKMARDAEEQTGGIRRSAYHDVDEIGPRGSEDGERAFTLEVHPEQVDPEWTEEELEEMRLSEKRAKIRAEAVAETIAEAVRMEEREQQEVDRNSNGKHGSG